MNHFPVIYRIGMALLLCTLLTMTGCSCRQDRVPPKNTTPSVEKTKSPQQKTEKQQQQQQSDTKPQKEPQKNESDTPSESQNDSQNQSQGAGTSNSSTNGNSKPGGTSSGSGNSGNGSSGETNSEANANPGSVSSGGQPSQGGDVPFAVPGTRTIFGNKNKADSTPLTRGEINDRMAQAEKNLERAKKYNGKKDFQSAYDRSVECWTQLQSLESNQVNGLETLRQDCLVQMKIASGQLNKKAAVNSYDRTNIIEYK